MAEESDGRNRPLVRDSTGHHTPATEPQGFATRGNNSRTVGKPLFLVPLIKHNFSPRWVPFLLDAAHEAVHWSTVGKAEATDSEIMAFAAVNDYVVLTNDLDFAAILASTHHKKPSVV